VTGHIIPKDDDAYDLGSMTKEFRDLHVGRDARIENFSKKVTIGGGGELADVDALVLGATDKEGGDIKVYRDTAGNLALHLDADAGQLKLVPATASGNALVIRDSGDTEDRIILREDQRIIFPTALIKDVGYYIIDFRSADDTAWGQLRVGTASITTIQGLYDLVIKTVTGASRYIELQSHDGTAFVTHIKMMGGVLTVLTNLLPDTDNAVDLGSSTLRWKDGYFSNLVSIRRDAGDYGGNFANYTPPTGREGALLVAEDTNAVSPGRRLYVYSGGAWRYVDLLG